MKNKYKLNKQQYRASLSAGGINLVIAGAGTGKTKVLVEKVKNIISEKTAKPENILILTFSNKAAGEIKSRIKSITGKDADRITSGTFHSFCLNFLKTNYGIFLSEYGFKEFPQVIGDRQRNLLKKELLQNFKARFYGMPVDVISGLADNTDSLDKKTFNKLRRFGILDELDAFKQVFRKYKIDHSLIDFRDMMDFTINIMTGNRSLKKAVRARYRYILIDEFQDTSEDNFKLIRLLLNNKSPNLFIVGDDWQSIYGFRNARIEYIVRIRKYFPDAKVYKLNINYRSRKEIISLSNNFISRNKYRTSKKLKSFRGNGGYISYRQVGSFSEEPEFIRNIIESGKNNSGSVAVLYRNNWQGEYLKNKLMQKTTGNFNSMDLDSMNLDSMNLDSINFMTMHSSKGLEFDSVIITGVSDEIIPDISSDIEEERRLLYVAMTRARDNLYIIHHKAPDGGPALFAKELGL